MRRTVIWICVGVGAAVSAGAAVADPWQVTRDQPRTVADLMTRIDGDAAFSDVDPDYIRRQERVVEGSRWAASTRDVWMDGDGYRDRLALRSEGPLRRADGNPLPPTARDAAMVDPDAYDVTYSRGWPQTLARSDSGVEMTFIPHAGVGYGSRGGVAEAGARVEIGRDLERLVPDGDDAFGDRPRWYVYAAGSGRAVGYNWARNRDGDYNRSGVTHDTGAFLGDASIGVAMRKGAVQSSVGVVYREIGVENWNPGPGVDRDVSEGLLAFQFSIKPE